ncbi:YsnF/AvaK domain-containing protein [Pseudomonas entomophila]|uniref:YsnF/AvaK domain-containing protein n=1 Tax=Pseudomonas entomophila TaxID=312306 RepID=UPI003EB82BD7
MDTRPDHHEASIPVLEEAASLSKRTVVTGITTVDKQVHSHEQVIRDTLRKEGASVERVVKGTPVDRDHPPQTRVEDGVTIIPVLEEVLVVEKRLVLKEELHIRPFVEDVPFQQTVSLRREDIVLTHRDAPTDDPQGDTPAAARTPSSITRKERDA